MAKNPCILPIPLALPLRLPALRVSLASWRLFTQPSKLLSTRRCPMFFVCDTVIRGPKPTASDPFIYVPPYQELSSNVVGLDVYNKDKQNIGTIKDIALDVDGLNGYIVSVGGFLGMGDHCVV